MQVDSLPAKPQGKPKNTGVGSLSLFQGIFPIQESNQDLLHCRQILYQLSYQGSPSVQFSSVAQSCLTLCDPMDCSQAGSSIHWDPPGKNTGVGYCALLQGIFPTHRSNRIMSTCIGRRILYHQCHLGSPSPDGKILRNYSTMSQPTYRH